MADFPAEPVAPSEFMETFIPAVFAEAEIPEAAQGVDLKLGVRLDGDGGGEWLLHLKGGALSVQGGSRDEAILTIIQSVDDWKGALWGGRGGVFGEQASAMFKQGGLPGAGGLGGAVGGGNPAALDALQSLNGVIRIVVTGGEGGDWATSVKLGPGEIPEEPTTTVTITAADAAAMQTGELDPMQAFMGGKIQIAGDMTLMMQMQAIAMQVAAPPTA